MDCLYFIHHASQFSPPRSASYAAYFDYKRRNDLEFRKSLKKAAVKQGKAEKVAAEKGAKEMEVAVKAAVLEANIEVEAFKRSVTGAEQGEAYFMQNVGNGEVLASMGASFVWL